MTDKVILQLMALVFALAAICLTFAFDLWIQRSTSQRKQHFTTFYYISMVVAIPTLSVFIYSCLVIWYMFTYGIRL